MKLSVSLSLLFALNVVPLPADETCISSGSDPDGDGSGLEQQVSCRVSEQSGHVPEHYHPETGELINIERLLWNTEDFANRSFAFCHGVVIDPYGENTCPSCYSHRMENTRYRYRHYADGTGLLLVESDNQAVAFSAEFSWSVDAAGRYDGPLPLDAYGERVDGAVRFWRQGIVGTIGFYSECNLAAFQIVQQELPNCIDTDGDGWGWDGANSCRTGTPIAGACNDSDGDGFGWNGVESCTP